MMLIQQSSNFNNNSNNIYFYNKHREFMFGPPKTVSKKPNTIIRQNSRIFGAQYPPLVVTRIQKDERPLNRQVTQLEKTRKRQIVSQTIVKSKPNIQTNQPPRQSGVDRYIARGSSRNTINFQGLKSGMGLAPANQFTKYLVDDQNVFYEDSRNVKNLKRIKIAKIYLLSILFILMGLYFLIGRIRPYPKGQCPSHADCQVFIHCHQGYVSVDDKCQIDPKILNQAQQISSAVIEQLSLDLGNSECLSLPSNSTNSTISKKITQVFVQFEIDDDLLKDEIANYFQNKQYQKQKNFTYKINTIIPKDKRYSFSCQMQLFYSTPAFKYLLLSLLISAILAIYFVRSYLQHERAKQIYKVLKGYTEQFGHIEIDVYKKEIESLYGKWDQSTWILVDKKRFEDLRIVYYIEQEHLYWKIVE